MIHHPIIFVPKLIALAIIVTVLVVLHGQLPPDQFVIALTLGAVAFVAVSVVAWVWAARMLGNSESALARATVLSTQEGAQEGFTASGDLYEALRGRRGKAVTRLAPSGTAIIDGRRVSVLTEGEFAEAETEVEVVNVQGSRIVVRAVKD